ncbi:MAG: hypothetical protein NT175_14000 [Bacteroidetes bacterium]|nr:hypothetical protein [Bacteroidota bacterium]
MNRRDDSLRERLPLFNASFQFRYGAIDSIADSSSHETVFGCIEII